MLFRKRPYAAMAAMLMLVITIAQARAQSDMPKFEVGAQFSLLRIGDLAVSHPGVGGRIGWNVIDYLSLEGEINLFPKKDIIAYYGGQYQDGNKTQGLFGVKTGRRSDKFGVFAKLRPGFVHFEKLAIDPCPRGALCILPDRFISQTKFALDVGGVLEFYPSHHVVLRFDLGDTIIRFSRRNLPAGATSNLQFNTGVGFRF
jgi:hypothetical protein